MIQLPTPTVTVSFEVEVRLLSLLGDRVLKRRHFMDQGEALRFVMVERRAQRPAFTGEHDAWFPHGYAWRGHGWQITLHERRTPTGPFSVPITAWEEAAMFRREEARELWSLRRAGQRRGYLTESEARELAAFRRRGPAARKPRWPQEPACRQRGGVAA